MVGVFTVSALWPGECHVVINCVQRSVEGTFKSEWPLLHSPSAHTFLLLLLLLPLLFLLLLLPLPSCYPPLVPCFSSFHALPTTATAPSPATATPPLSDTATAPS